MIEGFETSGTPTDGPEVELNHEPQVDDGPEQMPGNQVDSHSETVRPTNTEVRIEDFSQGDSSIPPED